MGFVHTHKGKSTIEKCDNSNLVQSIVENIGENI
jgi:hypothetical protein